MVILSRVEGECGEDCSGTPRWAATSCRRAVPSASELQTFNDQCRSLALRTTLCFLKAAYAACQHCAPVAVRSGRRHVNKLIISTPVMRPPGRPSLCATDRLRHQVPARAQGLAPGAPREEATDLMSQAHGTPSPRHGGRLIPSQTCCTTTGRLLLSKRTGARRAQIRELMRYHIAC